MSVDDNDFLAMGALKNGAFLSIKKPVTVDMLHCLWQHVLRERMKLYRKMEIIMGMDAANHHIVKGIGDERSNMQNSNYTGKKNICGQNSLDKEFESENQIINNIVKRKVCTEWTQDLHVKFMDAVVQLGEGRCFPKEILELMNVPGLTRTQVASHLQKCRNNNWRAPEERKSQQNNSPADSINIDVLSRKKPRRFGSMPPSKNTLLIKEHRETGQSSNIYIANENPNDGGRGHENINIAPIVDSHEQYHENFVCGQSNASTTSNSSSNSRYPLDDFFSFPDRDCLTQNFSGKQQEAEMIMNQRHCQKTLHFDQVYHEEINGTMVMAIGVTITWWSARGGDQRLIIVKITSVEYPQ
ncbi:two-component response regulator ARR14-like [Olea europaea subsp. europaea]|uniref:Two-component response regulator ARR14-like n=1 Tax=Olea europaea subsp. europaea TaxID=158383 RepID=A0A8S0S4E7_OLEEU|nr:two-component response regulator ARR14-like [Olea europaea subsp. europaea]